jgi:hypothetical protein
MAAPEPDRIASAVRFWEFARIPYNLVLLTIVVVALFAGLGTIAWENMLAMLPAFLLLAIAANVLFCAAYPVDLIVQATPLRAHLTPIRWTMFALGAGAAVVLAATMLFGLAFAGGLGPGD